MFSLKTNICEVPAKPDNLIIIWISVSLRSALLRHVFCVKIFLFEEPQNRHSWDSWDSWDCLLLFALIWRLWDESWSDLKFPKKLIINNYWLWLKCKILAITSLTSPEVFAWSRDVGWTISSLGSVTLDDRTYQLDQISINLHSFNNIYRWR